MENQIRDFVEASNTLDTRLEQSTKEKVAECARLLALNLAHYKLKYGELPPTEQKNMAKTDQISSELADLLASGMLEMIAALNQVTIGNTDTTDPLH